MARKLPPLNALRAFEAAARHSSFTHAAKELHVTHGAISQQIRVLEDYFQHPLFIRCKGKVELNPAGEDLLPVITSSLDKIEKISANLHNKRGTETLTIQLTAAFAAQWLIPHLGDFQQRYPNITIRLSPSHVFTGFQDQQSDVAVRWGTTNLVGVTMEKLFDVDTFAACSPSLMQHDHPLNAPENLEYHTLIHDDEGEAWHELMQATGVDGLKPHRELFFSDSALALQAATEGKGVIAAGSILSAHDLAAGRLLIPFHQIINHRQAYYLYYPEQNAGQRKVKAFRQWVLEKAELYRLEKIDLKVYLPAWNADSISNNI